MDWVCRGNCEGLWGGAMDGPLWGLWTRSVGGVVGLWGGVIELWGPVGWVLGGP